MKSVILMTAAFCVIASGYAQEGAYSYFAANPERFLNSPVTFYVLKCELIPINPSIQDGFALHRVTTSDQTGQNQSEAHVKVPLRKSQEFIYRHIHSREKTQAQNSSTNWSDYKKKQEPDPLPENGVFKMASSQDGLGRYLVGYYFDLTSE